MEAKIPGAEGALVELPKLRDYCLSKDHPQGRHKARVFEAALGLTADDSEELREALLNAALTTDAMATDATSLGNDMY